MDLGCGSASYLPSLFNKYPDIEYVGVEPIKASYDKAAAVVEDLPNAQIHYQLGYDSVPNEVEGSFDLVFSLSVLEHVKHLDKFIALSAKYVKSGGMMVHRYDLGHALHSHSLKEKLHVIMGNHIPQVLPERQFVRYVGVPEVEKCYTNNGVKKTKVTYHQMPNHKAFEKIVGSIEPVEELFAWEMEFQTDIDQLPVKEKETLFPAVAVWGEKV
tara:strand:- start:2930 stop:3571 length:642 start_codon:yes stop_codon:yes gene_type:complete